MPKASDAISETPDDGDGKVSKELEKAEEDMMKGDMKLDDEEFDKAIDHFKKAWKHAQKALKRTVEE